MNDIQDQIANHYSKLIDDIKSPDQAKALQQHIAQSVQDGSLYGYLGVPLVSKITGKMNEMQSAQALKSGLLNQPPIAQQTLAQAQAPTAPPAMPQGMPQQPMSPGIAAAQSNLPTQAAQGGIMGFAVGGVPDSEEMARQYISENPDEEDDDTENEDQGFEDAVASGMKRAPTGIGEEEFAAALNANQAPTAGIVAAPGAQMVAEKVGQTQSYQGPGMNKPVVEHREETRVREPAKETDMEKARHYNVGNLRPSGFEYKGQIGKTKSGFALFDSPEAGIAALNQDIGAKLKRGVDTPEKFINIYAPSKSKGGDNPNNLTNAYIANVSKALGIGPGDKIPNTPEGIAALRDAIVRQEGAQYTHLAKGGIAHFDGTDGSKVTYNPYNGAGNTDIYASSRDPYSLQNLLGSNTNTAPVDPARQAQLDRLAMAKPFAAAGDIVAGPINYLSQTAEKAANAVGIPRLGRALGIYDPDVTSVGLPRIGNGSNTPFYDIILQKEANAGTPAATQASTSAAPVKFGDYKVPDVINNPYQDTSAAPTSASQQAVSALGGYDEMNNQADQINSAYVRGAAPVQEVPSVVRKESLDPFASFNEYLAKREGSLQDKKQRDFYMSLLSAGLGMMGKAGQVKPGEVHTAIGDIGEGSMPGITYAMNANKENTAEENAILGGHLGMARYHSLRDLQEQQAAQHEADKLREDERIRLIAGNTLEQRKAEAAEKAENRADIRDTREQAITNARKKDLEANLLRMESQVRNGVLAVNKGGFKTEEEKEQMVADALDKLYRDNSIYRGYHKELFGDYPILPPRQSTPGGAGWSATQK